MLGSGTGSSLLDCSLESSTSSGGSGDPLRPGPGSPPEYTLVTFLFHAVGAATSKLHQMVFSPVPGQARISIRVIVNFFSCFQLLSFSFLFF